MVFFINLTFNDLSGNIHGNAADLAFDFIDRFLFLLGNLFFCLVFQGSCLFVMELKTDPSVLAGVRVELDGKLFDGTVKGRLAELSRRISDTVV